MNKTFKALAASFAVALALTGCTSDATDDSADDSAAATTQSSPAGETTDTESAEEETTDTESAEEETTDTESAEEGTSDGGDVEDLAALAEEGDVQSIGFIGFWASNSFTRAMLAAVQETADEAGIEVTDLSPANYDAAAQAATLKDATVSGDYDMMILLAADSIGILPATQEAIEAGITVVASFVNLGDDFESLEPAVDGLVVVAETPTGNGRSLAQLAIAACGSTDPCNVAYLEGLAALPLDAARTDAFVDELSSVDTVELVAQVEGGYDPDSGQAAAQDVLQANDDVDAMVGSSQAIIGAQKVVDTSEVALIGNGASVEAHEAVMSGEWFAHYNLDLSAIGSESVKLGLQAAAGMDVEPLDSSTLANPLGTADVIADNEPTYSDLG